jgi:tetratricopeptide (TPR) repeat protein
MKRKKMFLVLALVAGTITTWAQCGDYAWPADKAKAEKYVETFEAAIKAQDYKHASAGIQWMLANAPKWHSKLYVEAIETYDKLADQELDPSSKQKYVDSLLLVYDIRLSNKCGEEAELLNRKAISAYKYNAKNKSKAGEVLALLDRVFEISSTDDLIDNNLAYYAGSIKSNYMMKKITDEQALQRYNKLAEVIAAKSKKAEADGKSDLVERYKKISNGVPDFDVTKNAALTYAKNKNFDKIAPLMTQLQDKATTPVQKAWVDIVNGDVEFQKGNKPGARDFYKKALATDPTSKEANEHLGDLYVSSTGECTKTPGSAEEKLVYIAAFQIYKNSGNREKMQKALDNYPTAADLQKAGWKTGEAKKIECWIDETVTVKARSN